MGWSEKGGEAQYDPKFCDERHENEKEHRSSLEKAIDKVDAKINAVIMFLITTVVGILVYVGQAVFTKVFP